jgi:hypothetical protein
VGGDISLSGPFNKEEMYIQYRDQETNNLEIVKYTDFLKTIPK